LIDTFRGDYLGNYPQPYPRTAQLMQQRDTAGDGTKKARADRDCRFNANQHHSFS
jgi:hypothetical protein